MQSNASDIIYYRARLADLERETQQYQLVANARRAVQEQQVVHRHARPRLWLGAWLTHLGDAFLTVGDRCRL